MRKEGFPPILCKGGGKWQEAEDCSGGSDRDTGGGIASIEWRASGDDA